MPNYLANILAENVAPDVTAQLQKRLGKFLIGE